MTVRIWVFWGLCGLLISVLLLAACPGTQPVTENGSNQDVSGNGSSNGAQINLKTISYKQIASIDGSATKAGKFVDLRAVAATDDSIYIADREFSEVHIYGSDGKLMQSIGCGFRVKDYVLTDEQLLETYSQTDESLPPEQANEIALHRFFRVEDLELAGGHLYILNSYYTTLVANKALGPKVFEYTLQGKYFEEIELAQFISPSRLAISPSLQYAVCDSIYEDLQIGMRDEAETYVNKQVSTNVRNYFSNILKFKDSPAELSAFKTKYSNQGMRKEQYQGIGGVSMYTPVIDGKLDPDSTKVIVCDSGNARVKILGMRGQILKIVDADLIGYDSLKMPADVAVDVNGNMYILDTENNSVIVVDKTFEFKGVIESDQFASPVSVDVNDKGIVWVADKDAAKVFGFEQE